MDSGYEDQRRTGGYLWGQQRVAARVSLRQLANASGINKGVISLMEHGRLIPTGVEYERITAALAGLIDQAAPAATIVTTEE
jgi:transcriptional regulator with XRE-family HTH domain